MNLQKVVQNLKNIQKEPYVARLAPTPSGSLHLGNACNFYLMSQLCLELDAQLNLRVDDFDPSRCRKEYLEEIFWVLHFLGIQWSDGPHSLSDFALFSLQQNKALYFKALQTLIQKKITYVCSCSRSLSPTANGCVKGCKEKSLEFIPGKNAIRLNQSKVESLILNSIVLGNPSPKDDFVLWTKNDFASYQLVSVVEDKEKSINLIVRGQDLFESSQRQAVLAMLLGKDFEKWFSRIQWIHHPVILKSAKSLEKLSKSDRDLSLKYLVEQCSWTLDDFKKYFNSLNWFEA